MHAAIMPCGGLLAKEQGMKGEMSGAGRGNVCQAMVQVE
jgi:hypothetical protein